MPRSTFFNLSQEKSNRIFEAALDEFSQHRFSEASINRIVKAAGIPRGSFYQYFDGKEDLYLYVMERIGNEKLSIFSDYLSLAPEQTFFDSMLAAMPAMLDWIEQCPRYYRIAVQMTFDGSDFIQDIIKKLNAPRQKVVDLLLLDQQKGLIRADVDPELILDIYYAVAPSLMQESYAAGKQDPLAFSDKVRAIFDILANGFLPRGEKEAP